MFGRVLDTLIFKDGEIFLKRFHAQRSFEACQLENASVKAKDVEVIYDVIEKNYLDQATGNKILRVLIDPKNQLQHQVEVVEKTKLPETLRLQVLRDYKLEKNEDTRQNYKWENREFWNEALKLKKSSADDIIALNSKGEVLETSRCNLFFFDEKKNLVVTPLLSTGCINGVYRRYVMEKKSIMLPELGMKDVFEELVTAEQLHDFKIYAANSVREVVGAQLE